MSNEYGLIEYYVDTYYSWSKKIRDDLLWDFLTAISVYRRPEVL